MAGRRRRPGTDILERVENTLGHSIVKDWGGRLPAVPPTLRGGPLTSSEFGTGDDSDQALVEHVNLSLSDFPVPASGGGDLAWDVVAGPPQQVRGFSSLMAQIPSGPVTDIPIDVTGAGIVTLKWKWGEYPTGYKMAGDITITLTRGSSTIVQTTTVSPATRRGDGITSGWEFESGDTLTVAFPNSSVSSQTLGEARVGVMIWETAPSASNVPVPTPAELVDFTTSGTTSNPGTIHLDVPTPTVSDGDLMIAILLLRHGGTEIEPDPTATGWTLRATESISGGSSFLLAAVLTKVASSEGATQSFDLGVTAFDGGVNPYGMVANVGPADVGTLVTASVDGTSVSSVTVPSMTTRMVHLYGSMFLAAGATGGTLDDATSLASTATILEKQQFWQGAGGAARDFTFSSGATDAMVVIGMGVS